MEQIHTEEFGRAYIDTLQCQMYSFIRSVDRFGAASGGYFASSSLQQFIISYICILNSVEKKQQKIIGTMTICYLSYAIKADVQSVIMETEQDSFLL